MCLVCDWPNDKPPVSQITKCGKGFLLQTSKNLEATTEHAQQESKDESFSGRGKNDRKKTGETKRQDKSLWQQSTDTLDCADVC